MKTSKKQNIKQPKLRRYHATATVTETYTTEVEAQNEEEAERLCMEVSLAQLEPDDFVGEWEFEEIVEEKQGDDK